MKQARKSFRIAFVRLEFLHNLKKLLIMKRVILLKKSYVITMIRQMLCGLISTSPVRSTKSWHLKTFTQFFLSTLMVKDLAGKLNPLVMQNSLRLAASSVLGKTYQMNRYQMNYVLSIFQYYQHYCLPKSYQISQI